MDIMKYEEELNLLKKQIDKAKSLKFQAEARLEELERQKKEITEELEELGVSPENIGDEIIKLEKEIDTLFREAKENIPTDLLRGD